MIRNAMRTIGRVGAVSLETAQVPSAATAASRGGALRASPAAGMGVRRLSEVASPSEGGLINMLSRLNEYRFDFNRVCWWYGMQKEVLVCFELKSSNEHRFVPFAVHFLEGE